MTEGEWKRMQNTMHLIVEQQAKFEGQLVKNAAAADKRFSQAEKRLVALERLADRATRAADRRMAKAEAETAELKADLRSFLQAMRRSMRNGKGQA